MNGLMNLFGNVDPYGLTSLMDPEQKRALQGQAQMAMASKLLQASGPSTTPTSLGQAMGQAYSAGQEALQKGQLSAMQQMLLKDKLETSKAERLLEKNKQATLSQFTQQAVASGELTEAQAKLIQSTPSLGDEWLKNKFGAKKPITLSPGSQLIDPVTQKVITSAPFKPAARPAPGTEAGQAVLDNFIAEAGGDVVKGSLAYIDAEHERELSKARARGGMDPSGRLSISATNALLSQTRQQLKPEKEALGKFAAAKILWNQARNDQSGVAQAQLDRQMATFVGDKQLSKSEVDSIVKVGSLPRRVEDALTRWVSGVPSNATLDEQKTMIDALEQYYGTKLNTKAGSLRKVYKDTGAASNIIDTVVGEEWTPFEPASLTTAPGVAAPGVAAPGDVPAGIDPALWEMMHEEERNLWR